MSFPVETRGDQGDVRHHVGDVVPRSIASCLSYQVVPLRREFTTESKRSSRGSTSRRGDLRTIPDERFHNLLSAVRWWPGRAIDGDRPAPYRRALRRATSFTRRFAHDAPSNSRASISRRSSAGRRSFVPTRFAQRVRSASRSSPRAIVERWHSSFGRRSSDHARGRWHVVTVEHRGFERLGPGGEDLAARYAGRWPPRPSGLCVSG